jgi:hypothetical protein
MIVVFSKLHNILFFIKVINSHFLHIKCRTAYFLVSNAQFIQTMAPVSKTHNKSLLFLCMIHFTVASHRKYLVIINSE